MRALQFLTGHSAFKLSYNQIYQLKTPMETSRHSGSTYVQKVHMYPVVPNDITNSLKYLAVIYVRK